LFFCFVFVLFTKKAPFQELLFFYYYYLPLGGIMGGIPFFPPGFIGFLGFFTAFAIF
jgi:hypothetical protein